MFARSSVDSAGDRADILIRLRYRHAVTKASDRTVVMRRPAGIFAVEIGWQPQFRILRKLKSGREHADHRVDCAFDFQVRLRQASRRSEMLLPVAVADKNGPSGAFFRVAGAQIPADNRLDA